MARRRNPRDLSEVEFAAALKRHGFTYRHDRVSGNGIIGWLMLAFWRDSYSRRAMLANVLKVAEHDRKTLPTLRVVRLNPEQRELFEAYRSGLLEQHICLELLINSGLAPADVIDLCITLQARVADH